MTPKWCRTCNRHGMESIEDSSLHVHEQAIGCICHTTGNCDQKDTWQQIIHIVVHTRLDGASKYIHEKQHHRYWGDGNGDNGIDASKNMSHRASSHNTQVIQKVYSLCLHSISLLLFNDGEKYFFQRGLLFHIFNLSWREEFLQIRERTIRNDRTLMEDCYTIGQLFGLLQVLRG